MATADSTKRTYVRTAPTLSPSELKRRKQARRANSAKAQITIGLENVPEWQKLKEDLQLKDNPSVVRFLLDHYYATKNAAFLPGSGAPFPARFEGLPAFYPRPPTTSGGAASQTNGYCLSSGPPPLLMCPTSQPGSFLQRPLLLQNFPVPAQSAEVDEKPVIVAEAQSQEGEREAAAQDVPRPEVGQQPVFPRESPPRSIDPDLKQEKSPPAQTSSLPAQSSTPAPDPPSSEDLPPASPQKSPDQQASAESPKFKDMVDYPDGYTDDRDFAGYWESSDENEMSISSHDSDEEQEYWSKRKRRKTVESDSEWMPNVEECVVSSGSGRSSPEEMPEGESDSEESVEKVQVSKRRRRKPKNPRSTKAIAEVVPGKKRRGRPPKDRSTETPKTAKPAKTPKPPKTPKISRKEKGDGSDSCKGKESKVPSAKKLTHLYSHKLIALGDGEKVLCQKCNITFETWKEAENHVGRTHAYTCDICYQTFVTASVLKRHREEEHKEPHNFRKTKETGPMICPVCSASFLYFKSLTGHMRQAHASEPQPEPVPTNLYQCQVCKEPGFVSIIQLGLHVTTHFREGPLVKCKMYKCMYTFPTEAEMEEHCQTKHPRLLEKREKRSLCQECGMIYYSKRSLNSHIQEVHTRIRNVPCDWPGCNKSFFRNDHLLQHLMIHTGEKPLMCEFCNFTCRQQNSLRCHMKKHGIEKRSEKPKDDEKNQHCPRRGRKKWDQTKLFPFQI